MVRNEQDLWFEVITDKKFAILFDSGMRLIPRSDSNKFLDWAQAEGIVLLGAEGFTYDDGTIMPLMDCIIDYSNGDPAKSIALHREILSNDPAWTKVDFIDFTVRID